MGENRRISPLDVAGFFLKASEENGVTHLKLNKLVYLAHGWYWGNREEPLITNGEDPEAWRYGPVYKSIFNMFGRFRAEIIPAYMHRGVSDEPVEFGEDKTEFLELVWNTYKNVSPWTLVKALHEEGSPWYIVWRLENGKNSYGKPVPDYLTKAYYLDKVQKLHEK